MYCLFVTSSLDSSSKPTHFHCNGATLASQALYLMPIHIHTVHRLETYMPRPEFPKRIRREVNQETWEGDGFVFEMCDNSNMYII